MLTLNQIPKSVLFAAAGGSGGFAANLLSEIMMKPQQQTLGMILVHVTVWSAMICFGIGILIMIAQNILLHKPPLVLQQCVPIIAGSAIGGGIAGFLAQLFYSISAAVLFAGGETVIMGLFHSVIARSAAWAMMGGITAFGMSYCIANLNKLWALLGGLIGGALGCIGFLILTLIVGDAAGRLIGMSILGACIGAMVGWVESTFRKVWLMVVFDPRNVAQVNLGTQLVTVGGSNRDIVFIPGAEASAGTFLLAGNTVQYKSKTGRQNLNPGDRISIGKVELIVCSDDVQFAPSKFYPMRMSKVPR
ncbi:hypothetical protein FACS189419_01540 [Planctomycetales bacterium]|nr:hypothetical protein FACS189419_01540 [Planctomycetales bacterium]